MFLDSRHAFSAYFHNLFHTKIANCLNNTCKDHWDIFSVDPDLTGFRLHCVLIFQSDGVSVEKLWPLHRWRRNAHSSGCAVRIRLQICLYFRHIYPHEVVLIPKVFSFSPGLKIAWIFFFNSLKLKPNYCWCASWQMRPHIIQFSGSYF